MNDTKSRMTFSSSVECPYCGSEQDECYPEPNGDWQTIECQVCERNFKTSAFVEYQSKRSCKENGLACDLESDEGMNLFESKSNWFKCKNCLDTTTTIREILEVK